MDLESAKSGWEKWLSENLGATVVPLLCWQCKRTTNVPFDQQTVHVSVALRAGWGTDSRFHFFCPECCEKLNGQHDPASYHR